ncbi:MAG: outer membrane lipoprotein chaperone LolA [Proteobacteria bacterium]|nr:outer membrane lipoprotein chaperone LolA [Pseudomonadota bacterium]
MTLSAARKNLFLGILLILGIVRASSAQGESDGQRLIDDFINNVQTMSGRFEQQLVDADDIVIDKSSGTIEIQKPGRFRWTYLEPYEQILVADGLNIWSYDVDLEQVTVKAQAKVLASTPALLLGGAQDVLDDFEYIGSFAERDIVWVRLRPKTTDNGFTKVELGFKEGKLSRMIFGDNLGQTTLIALFDLSLNESIDAQRFSFTPPDGVDVVGQPLSPAPADL